MANNQCLMNTAWLAITVIVPYVAGMLVYSVPTEPSQISRYIECACYFYCCLLICHMALFAAENFVRGNYKKFNVGSIISATLLGFSALFALTMLQISKLHFEKPFFYLVLFIVACATVSVYMQKKVSELAAIVVLFFYDLAVAYATFAFVGIEFNWQILLFSAGLAGQVLSCRLARSFEGSKYRIFRFSPLLPAEAHLLTPTYWASKLYLLALMSAIIAIGALALLGLLHPLFFAIYGVLPLVGRLAEDFRLQQKEVQNIPEFVPRNTRILLFITVIIPTVGLLLI